MLLSNIIIKLYTFKNILTYDINNVSCLKLNELDINGLNP